MRVQIGDPAPRFEAQVTDGKNIQAFTMEHELAKNVPIVLAFFPFAFTGVCETQLLDLTRRIDALDEANARVFGVSVDSPFTLRTYHTELALEFPLISDFNREAIEAYDLAHDRLLGLQHPSKRATVIINPQGTIAWTWTTDDPEEKPRIDAIVQAVRKANGNTPSI